MSKSKIKILHLVQHLYLGGLERILQQFAKHCPEEIELYFFAYETKSLQGIGKEISQMGFSVSFTEKKAGYDWNLLAELNKFIRENGIDIVHTHDFGPMEYAVPLKINNPKIKLFHTQHTIHHFLPNWKYRWFFQFASYFYKKIICVSNYQLTEIIKSCPLSKRNMVVVPNGVDTKFFKEESKPIFGKKLKLVNLSRLSPEKNLIYILRTCLKLKNANIDFEFHHAGTGNPEEEKSINSFIAQNQLEKFVNLYGFQSDVRSVLEKGDIFVTSSLEECHPVALLEAMSTGKACLCSAIAPHLEISDRSLVFFDHKKEEGLFEVLLGFIDNEEKLNRLSKMGRLDVEEFFSLDTMLNKYYQGYEINRNSYEK